MSHNRHTLCFNGSGISLVHLFLAKWYPTLWLYQILLVNPHAGGHSVCFLFGAIMNNAVIIHTQVFVWASTCGFERKA